MRNARVDALRFVAIAMVVMTHVLNLRWEFKLLPGAPETVRAMMSFNMPLFAFVSGFVLLGREGSHPVRFIRGKALALLVPYFAWVAFEMPLRRSRSPRPRCDSRARAVDPRAGFQMWFLLVLFVCFVVFALSRWVSSSDAVTALWPPRSGSCRCCRCPMELARAALLALSVPRRRLLGRDAP